MSEPHIPDGDEKHPSEPEPEFDALVERHMSGLQAFVRMRAGPSVRGQESLSDVVQSVCREVLHERDRFEYQGEAQFRSWLFTAALRKIIEKDRFYHRQKRDIRREIRADPGGEQDGDKAPRQLLEAYGDLATPSQLFSAQEQLEVIEGAFDSLTEEQREVLSLSRLCGMSYAEIAERVGKNEAACRQLVRRATIRLSMALEKAGL